MLAPALIAILLLQGVPPPRTVRVDAGARAGGTGTRSRPFRTLGEAVAALGEGCGTMLLATGTYQAPALPGGCTLEGMRGARPVLDASKAGEPWKAPYGVRLIRLAVEGSLEAGGPVVVEDVHWRAGASGALQVGDGQLRVTRSRFSTPSPAPRAIEGSGGTIDLEQVRFEGPFARALEVKDLALRARAVRFEGPATALSQRGGTLDLEDLRSAGGQDAAITVSRVSGRIARLSVVGHEYALLVRESRSLVAEDLFSRQAVRGAFAFIQTQVKVSGLVAWESGSFGGVQVVGGELELSDLWVHRALEQAISVRSATVTLRDVRITEVRAGGGEGHALQLRAGQGTVHGLQVWDAPGVGLWIAESARVTAGEIHIVSAGVAGVAVEGSGVLDAQRITVERSAASALAVGVEADVRIAQLHSLDNAGGAGAVECGAMKPKVQVLQLTGRGALSGLDGGCEAPQ